MSVQEVAEGLSLSSHICRLKLSRHEVPTLSRKNVGKTTRFDVDPFSQQQKHATSSTNNLSVGLFLSFKCL